MKRQFRASIVLISCFMSMLLLSPLACWADQTVGFNEYESESVPETQSDSSDQTAAAVDEATPSVDVAVEPKRRSRTSAINLTFQALAGSQRLHRMARSLAQRASLVGLRQSGFPSLIQKTSVSNTALMFKMKAGRVGFLMELSPAQQERAFRLKPSSSS